MNILKFKKKSEDVNFSIFSWIIYYLCKLLITEGKQELDESENYFDYEVRKSDNIDGTFSINLQDKIVLEIGSGYGGYMYHALMSGAKFVFGIEIDVKRVEESKKIINEKYMGENYEVLHADSRHLDMIQNNSIDIVVSDAVIEHIIDIRKVFDNVERMLKPGGKAYLSTSPIWYTYNGGHLWRYIPIPWAHIFFSSKTIVEVLKIQKYRNDFPIDRCEKIIDLYITLGKLSLHKIRKEVVNSGLKLESLRNISGSRIKRFLIKFPILEEFFAGGIKITLSKDKK